MKWIVTSLALLILNSFVFSQTTLVGWDFEDSDQTADIGTDGTGNAPNNLNQTITGSINLSGPTYPAGNNPTPGVSFSYSNWSIGEYLVFTVNTTNFTDLTVEFDVRSSNTGPRDFKVSYSTNGVGGTFTDISGATFQTPTNFGTNPMFIFNLPVTSEQQADLAIRLECTSDVSANGGTIGATGTFRIDNINVISSLDTPLPVELASFTAAAGDGKVTLRWATQSEVNNERFEIMRSETKEGQYNQIGERPGQFNSNQLTYYSFVDNFVANDSTYWYKLVDVDVNGVRTEHGPVSATPQASGTEITTIDSEVPRSYRLYPAYPNPFNPSTNLKFDVPSTFQGLAEVTVEVYNTLGQRVRSLFSGTVEAGTYALTWDGATDSGIAVPGGVYFAVMKSGFYKNTVKMALVK